MVCELHIRAQFTTRVCSANSGMYGFYCHPWQTVPHCLSVQSEAACSQCGKERVGLRERDGLKIVHPCTIFNSSFEQCSKHRLPTAFPTSCRNNSCKSGFLRALALKRYLEDGLGFREGKKLLVAKVSSLP